MQELLGRGGLANLYQYANNSPLVYIDPDGLLSRNQVFGGLRVVGGFVQATAGYGLATASAAFGVATSWTGVGLGVGAGGVVVGGAVGLHGIDQMQAGIRQIYLDRPVDSLTSEGLQMAGMSQSTANLVDTGISVVGSAGAGFATAGIKVMTIRATDPLAQGLSAWQILRANDIGSRALMPDDFHALGGFETTSLAKYNMMQQGVDHLGNAFQHSTSLLQSTALGFTPKLLKTGPTAAGAMLWGASGSALTGFSGSGDGRCARSR